MVQWMKAIQLNKEYYIKKEMNNNKKNEHFQPL